MSWAHDAFGNRLAENQGGSPSVAMPTSTSATYNSSNQLLTSTLDPSGNIQYDAAGDVTYDGNNSYLYDAEGRICATQHGSNPPTGYIYDGSGIRVAKGQLSRFTCDFNSADTTTYNGFAPNTSWALGQGGEQVGEWKLVGSTWTWQHSNVFAGKLLGTYDTTGLHFYFDDWLGTRRIQTNATGQLELTCQSLPYGNGENCIPTLLATAEDPTEQHFTGKERDTESGNDYFGARYYASSMGRWLSPDWSAKAEPVPYAKLDNPQSLNLYAYVGNNPMTRFDADGHIQRDKDGNVIFKPKGDVQNRGFTYQYTGADGKKFTVTVSWQVQPGYVKADDGTKIQAEKPTSDVQAQTTDSAGKVVHSGIAGTPGLGNVHPGGYSADCHGTTFASGQVWINNDQVPALLKGDGFTQTSSPHTWDVGVYSGSSGVDHSVRVLAPGQTVLSKGGITDMTITTPANGWHDHSDTLTYYTQHPDQ